MKYYRDVDYFLYFMDFPHMGVPGVIVANSDGTSNIYINTLYCRKTQDRTIKHELRHLVKNHLFIDTMTITEKELEAEDTEDPSCIFAEDFSSVEFVEQTVNVSIENVFQHIPGVIPVFNSLDAFRDYMFSMKKEPAGQN